MDHQDVYRFVPGAHVREFNQFPEEETGGGRRKKRKRTTTTRTVLPGHIPRPTKKGLKMSLGYPCLQCPVWSCRCLTQQKLCPRTLSDAQLTHSRKKNRQRLAEQLVSQTLAVKDPAFCVPSGSLFLSFQAQFAMFGLSRKLRPFTVLPPHAKPRIQFWALTQP